MCLMVASYCASRSTMRTPTVRPRLRASWQTRCIMTDESLPPENETYSLGKVSNAQETRSRDASSTDWIVYCLRLDISKGSPSLSIRQTLGSLTLRPGQDRKSTRLNSSHVKIS